MRYFNKPRTHLSACRCKGCIKKKREQTHEFRFMAYSLWCLIFLLIALF